MATPRSRAKEGKITEAFLRSLKRPGIHRDGVIPGFLVRAGKRARTFELRIERPPKANITWTCPPSRSVIAGAPPR